MHRVLQFVGFTEYVRKTTSNYVSSFPLWAPNALNNKMSLQCEWKPDEKISWSNVITCHIACNQFSQWRENNEEIAISTTDHTSCVDHFDGFFFLAWWSNLLHLPPLGHLIDSLAALTANPTTRPPMSMIQLTYKNINNLKIRKA